MPKDPSREAHFPAIEKRYGEKMSYWFKVMKEVKDLKYPEQIAHLRENYGFSQAHANALVMYSRGSTSSKRHDTHADFFKTIKPEQVKTMKKIFKVIKDKHPKVEAVIAWNQPMLKLGDDYIFGISASTNHMTMAFWSNDVLDALLHEHRTAGLLQRGGETNDQATTFEAIENTLAEPAKTDHRVFRKLPRDALPA
jgi:hypothetical protein